MERITKDDLERRVAYLNRITGSPAESYTRDDDGKYRANIGNYHLCGDYGGWQLHRMQTDGGGITDVLGGGYQSKRELYNRLNAFIQGIELAKGL